MQQLVLALCLSTGAGNIVKADICVVDDRQQKVCLSRPASRIVALAPHAAELLHYSGAGRQVVAAVEFADFPDYIDRLPKAGSAHTLSVEKIVGLRPDLVVAWPSGNPARALALLRTTGIPVYHSEPKGIGGIAENLRELGRLGGHAGQAGSHIRALQSQHQRLSSRYHRMRPVRAVLLVATRPMFTLSGNHAIAEAFHMCGAVNPFAGLPMLAPMLGKESLIAARPEVILTTRPVAEVEALLNQTGLEPSMWPAIHWLDPDLLLRISPRFMGGLEAFCKAVDTVRQQK